MNTILPIFIHSTPSTPDTCPECGKVEEIVCKCAHCGHEYETEDDTPGWVVFLQIAGIIAGILLFCALLFCFLHWLDKLDDPKFNRTFVQHLGHCIKMVWQKVITKLI